MRLSKTDSEAQKLLQELDNLHAGLQNRNQDGQQRIQSSLPAGDDTAEAEPPALVDQAVRNMARRELQQPPPPIGGKLRWIAGLSTVSIALIALGISLVQAPQIPQRVDTPEKSKGLELERRREETIDRLQPGPPSSYSTSAQDAGAVARSVKTESRLAESDELDSDAAASNAATLSGQAGDTRAEQAAKSSTELKGDEPEAWLSLIQQLHDQALHAEAREQLVSLVREYPDFPLPDWALRLQRQDP